MNNPYALIDVTLSYLRDSASCASMESEKKLLSETIDSLEKIREIYEDMLPEFNKAASGSYNALTEIFHLQGRIFEVLKFDDAEQQNKETQP